MNIHRLDSPPEDEFELELALWLSNAQPDDLYVLKVLSDHYAGDIMRFFLAVYYNKDDRSTGFYNAKDHTQRMLHEAVGSLHSFQGQESVRNWLFTLAVSQIKTPQNKHQAVGGGDKPNTPAKHPVQNTAGDNARSKKDQVILSSFHELSHQACIPVILHYLYRISTANISRIMGVRIPAVHESIKNFRMQIARLLSANNNQIMDGDLHHSNYEAWMQLSIDGILGYDPISQGKLNRHFETCPECRTYQSYLCSLEGDLKSAFSKLMPIINLDDAWVNQIVESFHPAQKKPSLLSSKIRINRESILLGLLLLAVIFSGYFITRREIYFANPIIYPTLTLKPAQDNEVNPPSYKYENTPQAIAATPTALEGSSYAVVQFSDDGLSAVNQRNYIYFREPVISSNERMLVFSTSFTTISDQGPVFNNALYLLDQLTGEIITLNKNEAEYPVDIWNFSPDISESGAEIVFQDVTDTGSSADPPACNWQTETFSCTDVYLFDRETNSVTSVSTLINGNLTAGPNVLPSISADGRWIVFWSADKGITLPDEDLCVEGTALTHCWNVVIINREAGERSVLPVSRQNSKYTAWDFEPLSLSDDGQMIALTIHKDDQIAAELQIENQKESIIFDRRSGAYQFVNTTTSGGLGNGPSTHALLSGDGRSVAFVSSADNLVEGDTNEVMDVFVRQISSPEITRVSVSSEAIQANDASGVYFYSKESWKESLDISKDGRYVTFMSSSDNLSFNPPTDCPASSWFPCTNVYVHDLGTDLTNLVSTGSHRRDSIYNHISISPLGRWIVYVKSDVDCYQAPVCSMIYRYDLETGENVVVMDNKLIGASQLAQKPQARQLFEDSMSAVTSLAFSPDGGLLASGSNDKSIRLWDASSGTLLETMTAHEQLVSDIDFSHDGLFLASASHDGVVNIWDLETNVNDTLSKDSGAILSLDFSPINRSLVVGGVQASWVWDVTEFPPRIKHSQRFPGAQINIVKYSAEGDLMAQGSSDDSVWIRNSADGKFVTRLAGHEGDILSLAFSPDGKYLASGSADSLVNIWEVHNTGAGEIKFERVLSIRHFDWINDLAFSPDSKLLAVASFGSDVTLWEIPSGDKVGKSFASRWYQPLSVEFSPEGDLLAVGSGWGGVQLWDNPVP